MSVYEAPPTPDGAEDGLEDVVGSRSNVALPSGSSSEESSQRWLVLRRGEQRMVLFRGWPEMEPASAFREFRMAIGLALTAVDLSGKGRFRDCGYVYIGSAGSLGSVFNEAVRDLARANWTVDREAVWPVIRGGYTPCPTVEPQQPARRVETDEKQTSLRMEA